MTPIPHQFKLFETASPFVQANGPFYYKEQQRDMIFGLLIEQRHCNGGNILHGGMVCTIADIAIGYNIAKCVEPTNKQQEPQAQPVAKSVSGPPGVPMATVSMSADFTGSANLGDWVEVQVDVHRVGGTLAFANAYLACNGQRIARVSAVFKLTRS